LAETLSFHPSPGIPLEINAYGLGGRFERSPQTRFSVADEVGAWIRAGRF